MAALTKAGFARPGYAELLQQQEARAKEVFGEEIDTGEQTALGKFIRIGVFDLAQLYEEMEGVYLARFPHHALGVGLDRLVPFAGIHRNPATAAVHRVRFEGQPGAAVPAGFLAATVDGVYFSTTAAQVLDADGRLVCTVQCTKRGDAGNVPSGGICVVVNPTAGVYSVQGETLLGPGEGAESDEALRERFDLTVQGIGSATASAVRAAVLRLPGVEGCVVLENDTEVTDAQGTPPHSFACYVLGDAVADEEIANAIFSKKPLGVRSHGQSEVLVEDEAGGRHTVRFSRVAQVPLQLQMTLWVSALFPQDGEEQLKSALVKRAAALSAGEALAFTSLYALAYAVPGVVEAGALRLRYRGESEWFSQNVAVGAAEAARLYEEDIDITVLAAQGS